MVGFGGSWRRCARRVLYQYTEARIDTGGICHSRDLNVHADMAIMDVSIAVAGGKGRHFWVLAIRFVRPGEE